MDSEHDKYAKEYDAQIKNYNCYIAEVLFGLSYEYIKKRESILDIGIGTGVLSRLFYSAGLKVFGLDGSAEMLKICDQKGFAKELIKQDILTFPWPFLDDYFNHVVCCGGLHFIGDLEELIEEISRVQKTDGIFAFTVMNSNSNQPGLDKYEKRIEDDLTVFSHKKGYINNLLKNNHYRKEKEIISFVGKTQFKAIVACKERA